MTRNGRGTCAAREGRAAPDARSSSILLLFKAFAFSLTVMWLIAPGSIALAERDNAAISEAIERIVESKRYQTDLPKPKPEPPKKKEKSTFGEGLGDAAYYLLIAIVVIGALYILYTLAQQKIALTRRGAVRRMARETTAAPPEAPTAEDLADAEAQALAAAKLGDFDEAIHILLLGAIGRLREKNARAAARSLTSREILSRVMLGPEGGEAKAALRALVAAVEISRFGGSPVDQDAFERCLEAYRLLRRAVSGGQTRSPMPNVGPGLRPA